MKLSFLDESMNGSDISSAGAVALTSPLVHSAPATLLALRAALLSRPELDTVYVLRDAGYAGGDELYDAFERYAANRGESDPQSVQIDHFFHLAGSFLTECGLGEVTLYAEGDAFCVVEIEGCWEAIAEDQPDPAGCHLTLGLIAAFLGRFADYPLSILEAKGPSTGSAYCRFLTGNAEMISDYYTKNAAKDS